MTMTDTRITRAIDLLESADSLDSPLVDDAIELLEAVCDELPAPVRVAWCPNDMRQTVAEAAQHPVECGLRLVSGGPGGSQ